jgi:hypothetical protein
MSTDLPSWPRRHFQPGGGEPYLLYCVFGSFEGGLLLSRSRCRVAGVPKGIEIRQRDPTEVLDENSVLFFVDPELRGAIHAAPQCLSIAGPIADSTTLDYLRDTVGIVTCALDAGGVAVLDAFTLRFWAKELWQQTFEPGKPCPLEHVVIIGSEEKDGCWWRTRGMRKFGRPDLSIHRVEDQYQDAVTDLLRFIDLMAQGAVIPEGQEVKLRSLPAGMTCHHGGSLDDEDFNNVHIEIRWPS